LSLGGSTPYPAHVVNTTQSHGTDPIPLRWFDRRSPYFLHRVGVLSAWLLLSLASVAWAMSGGEDNDLGARILVVDTGFGIAVSVQNESSEIWHNVRIVLEPGGWVFRKPAFRPNERFSAQVRDFEAVGAKAKKRHPDRNFRPRAIRVVADDGTYEKRF